MYLSDFLPNTLAYFGIEDDVEVIGFSIDSRSIAGGEVFVALQGENFDGNDFIGSALSNGASVIITTKDVKCDVPVIKVADPRLFVQEMASSLRSKMTLPIVAITGSAGKTTTKNLLANILSRYQDTLATAGNFNSLLGMPLSMLRLRDNHRYGVFELGTNSAGEIAKLAKILRPNIGIITNIGRAHLEGIGSSMDDVAKEKTALFANLADDKVAVINCDNSYFNYMCDMAKDNPWYGFTLNEELWQGQEHIWLARNIKSIPGGYSFEAVTAGCSLDIELHMLGRHNILNALAAIVVAKYLQVPDADIITGIAATTAFDGRLSVYENSFGRVIDDSYNANPESCKAAITALGDFTGKKILVLGDMMELGADAVSYHREIGEFAKQSDIDNIFCYGELSNHIAAGFGDGAYVYESQEDLLRELKTFLHGNWNVLVKGSASLKMSKIAVELVKLVT